MNLHGFQSKIITGWQKIRFSNSSRLFPFCPQKKVHCSEIDLDFELAGLKDRHQEGNSVTTIKNKSWQKMNPSWTKMGWEGKLFLWKLLFVWYLPLPFNTSFIWFIYANLEGLASIRTWLNVSQFQKEELLRDKSGMLIKKANLKVERWVNFN